MPIVTVTVRKPKTREFKTRILKAIHAALVEVGVDANDRFDRVLELDEGDFYYDESFPDVSTQRTDAFVLIEILIGVGRSFKVKEQVIRRIVERSSAFGFESRESHDHCARDSMGELVTRGRPDSSGLRNRPTVSGRGAWVRARTSRCFRLDIAVHSRSSPRVSGGSSLSPALSSRRRKFLIG